MAAILSGAQPRHDGSPGDDEDPAERQHDGARHARGTPRGAGGASSSSNSGRRSSGRACERRPGPGRADPGEHRVGPGELRAGRWSPRRRPRSPGRQRPQVGLRRRATSGSPRPRCARRTPARPRGRGRGVAGLVDVAGDLEGEPAAGGHRRDQAAAAGRGGRAPTGGRRWRPARRPARRASSRAGRRRRSPRPRPRGPRRSSRRWSPAAHPRPGPRSGSSAVRLPAPQPRSTTRAGVRGGDPRDQVDEGAAALVGVRQVVAGVPRVGHRATLSRCQESCPARVRAWSATRWTSWSRPGTASAPTSTWPRRGVQPHRPAGPAARPGPARGVQRPPDRDVGVRRAGGAAARGPPLPADPGALLRQTLVTSGTMTNRVDRLAERGLVERCPDPSDRRGVLVRLTAAGQDRRRRRLRDPPGQRARPARRPLRGRPRPPRHPAART